MNPLEMLQRAVDCLALRRPAPTANWQRRFMPARIPDHNPLRADPEAFVEAQRIALSLMDDDCYGFLLLTVRKEEGTSARIAFDEVLADAWWPAVRETMLRIVEVNRTPL